MKYKIIITGTHPTPALSIIDLLLKDSHQLYYFGRRTSLSNSKQKSIEHLLLPKRNIQIYSIIAGRWQRHNPFSLFKALLILPLGICQSIFYFYKIKPHLLISFGGYVSLPVCLSAKIFKTPIILHEQTFKIGTTQKLLTPLADKMALSWPQSQKYFPSKKTVLTGNPIRQAFIKKLNQPRQQIKPPLLYITAGNQGSKTINDFILQNLSRLLVDYQIVHQFGQAQSASDFKKANQIKKSLNSKLKSKYRLSRWFSSATQADLFKKASLVISRAGINTITELAVSRQKALLIPLPYTQKAEQNINADWLQKKGLAVVLDQSQLNYPNFQKALKQSLNLNHQQYKLSNQTRRLIIKASENLLNLIYETVKKN